MEVKTACHFAIADLELTTESQLLKVIHLFCVHKLAKDAKSAHKHCYFNHYNM